MKKLVMAISALTAAMFSTSANADISVSGSAGVGVSSGIAAAGTQITNGAALEFALSSDLGNGVTVSTSAGISLDSNDEKALSTVNATGLSNLSIATGGSSVTIGGDIDIAGDGVGEVGGVAGDLVDEGGYNATLTGMGGLTEEDGYGFAVTTAVGGATVTASFILDSDGEKNMATTDDANTATGVAVSLPVGNMSITLGAANDEKNSQSVAGGEISMALGGGSVTAGMAEMSPSSGNGTSTWGVEYATTMGGASVSVGYTNGSSGTSKSTRTELSVSQSIGAGASLFLDLQNGSGSGTTTAGTNVAVGTSFSF